MAGPRAPVRRPVHGRPRHRDRERRSALDPERPRVLPGEPPVGDQRLRPGLRRVPAARRPGRRHAGPPPHLPRRHRRVHRGLAAGRAGLVGGVPDRRPRLPGPRRGDHHAGRTVDPLHDVHRGPRAQHRARRLGCRRRLRRRGRRTPRWRPHRRPQLGVDLLRQRAGRCRRVRAGAAPAPGEPRRAGQEVRPARCRAGDRRALVPGLRDHPGRPGRLARAARPSPCSRCRVALLAGFVALGAAAPRAADALRDPPDPDGERGERRRVHHGHRAVLDVPDADALHAAGARLLRR